MWLEPTGTLPACYELIPGARAGVGAASGTSPFSITIIIFKIRVSLLASGLSGGTQGLHRVTRALWLWFMNSLVCGSWA